jgi:hypothetical protein
MSKTPHGGRGGGFTLPKDAARQEANHADNERQHAWGQRRRLWSAARSAAGAQEGGTPSKTNSLGDDSEEDGEDKEKGEINPFPQSPLPEDLPSLGDLFSWQTGISFGVHWPKNPLVGTGASFGPPPQSILTLVFSDLQKMGVVLVAIGTTHLLGVS